MKQRMKHIILKTLINDSLDSAKIPLMHDKELNLRMARRVASDIVSIDAMKFDQFASPSN